ncbi:MAG TPA: aminotransferase class I/II-fold pyridoxal phosphate-dependent enzyme [Anaerolineales bacterium]|nr:aminotransferase class I/II-fold pyridoxal phosphate-dependent enzyme [Anaerolineales bacterium]
MIQPAHRIASLSSHYFADLDQQIARLSAAGKDILRLDVGSPDLPPPQAVIDCLHTSASRPDSHGYQAHTGTEALRQAWAGMYRRLHSVKLDPESEIVPLIGSKEGIFHLHQALINPGDIVLVPDPGYITYIRGAQIAGGEIYTLPLLEENDFLPDLAGIPAEIARRAKLLWLNYPNNPTSAVASLEFFHEAVEFAKQYDLLLAHDAAYTQVTYDGYQAPSLLELPGASGVAIEFNTLSKSHNMAGWRVAAAVGRADVLRYLFQLKTNVDSSHFLPVLEAAALAMDGDQTWIAGRNKIYQARRDCVAAGLDRLSFHYRLPQASLYVWFAVPDEMTSAAFCQRALEYCGVSLTPGTIFGKGGEGFVRLSLTSPIEEIDLAMQRLEKEFAV